MLSLPEIVIICGVVVLLFGTKKLPQWGGAIGETIKNFKKGVKDDATPISPDKKDGDNR